MPYHFLVAPDGRIFEGRPTDYEGETNTEYDVTGHLLVQLWGDFEEQRVGVKQLRSAVRLVAWLCRRFRIPPRAIATHRGWSVQTSCPGRDLHRYFREGSFRRWVEETLRGGTPELRLGRPLPGGPTRPVPLPAPPRQPGSSERGERSRGKARHDHLPQGA